MPEESGKTGSGGPQAPEVTGSASAVYIHKRPLQNRNFLQRSLFVGKSFLAGKAPMDEARKCHADRYAPPSAWMI